jgi:hypothetical protein
VSFPRQRRGQTELHPGAAHVDVRSANPVSSGSFGLVERAIGVSDQDLDRHPTLILSDSEARSDRAGKTFDCHLTLYVTPEIVGELRCTGSVAAGQQYCELFASDTRR